MAGGDDTSRPRRQDTSTYVYMYVYLIAFVENLRMYVAWKLHLKVWSRQVTPLSQNTSHCNGEISVSKLRMYTYILFFLLQAQIIEPHSNICLHARQLDSKSHSDINFFKGDPLNK
jgi:hypothetical protein